MNVPVTLQISLAPSDWRHARELLPHQIRVWRNQVAEVLLTIDLHRSTGRFSSGWEEGKDRIVTLAQSIPNARVAVVARDEATRKRIAHEFFGGRPVPMKDFRGGPYYSYFFGLAEAVHDYVLHTDSDMFFGGGSPTWLNEAVTEISEHSEVLFAAPLPGPPASDGWLHSQEATTVTGRPYCFDFSTMSTRLYLVNRQKLRMSVGQLRARHPPALRSVIKALVEGNPPEDLPEHLFTHEMRIRDLRRREFLGSATGMWSLHPPYRCADFYDRLPELINRVETGDLPDAQRGDHDLNASLVDWSEAIAGMARNRWWKRLIHNR